MVSNVQLDDNIRIWLLEEEGFKSAPETWKCQRGNNVFGQCIPDPSEWMVSVYDSSLQHGGGAAVGATAPPKFWLGATMHLAPPIIGLYIH